MHQVLAICLRTRQKRVAVQLLYSVISTQQEISYFCQMFQHNEDSSVCEFELRSMDIGFEPDIIGDASNC